MGQSLHLLRGKNIFNKDEEAPRCGISDESRMVSLITRENRILGQSNDGCILKACLPHVVEEGDMSRRFLALFQVIR